MHTVLELSSAVAEAARTIHTRRTLDETLQTIVDVACNSVPGFDQVGISTLQKDGHIETRAHSGELVLPLDQVQYGWGEGPCSAALQGDAVISVSRLRLEGRWPRYVPEARALGVRSQMAVKLYLDGGTLGGMNFYSTTADDVTPDAVAIGRLLGAHAAIALGHAQEREELHAGMETRRVIGQAVGILMERYELDEDRAFAFLVRTSSQSNVKLRSVAQALVDERNAR